MSMEIGDWLPEETAPQNEIVETCQMMEGYVPAPMLMSVDGNLWHWEPDHFASSVIPTHWRPSPAAKAADRIAQAELTKAKLVRT